MLSSTVMCGNRLKAWKTIPMRRRMRSTWTPSRGDLLALDDDAPRIDRLEQVDAAQQRRLARAGRPDEADDLVLGDHEVDPAQDLELAERLVQALDAQGLGGHLGRRPTASPPAVAGDQPVDQRAISGIVTTRNTRATPMYGVKLKVAADLIWASGRPRRRR